ncbi:hypothetical protein CTAM01_00788, partial [Colletotrichum tamarilloi]
GSVICDNDGISKKKFSDFRRPTGLLREDRLLPSSSRVVCLDGGCCYVLALDAEVNENGSIRPANGESQVSKRYVFPEQIDLSRRLPSYDALDPENILASCMPLLLLSHHLYIALCSNFALSRARRVTLYTGPVHSTDPFEPWTHYGTQLGPGISTELMLE